MTETLSANLKSEWINNYLEYFEDEVVAQFKFRAILAKAHPDYWRDGLSRNRSGRGLVLLRARVSIQRWRKSVFTPKKPIYLDYLE